MYFLNKYPQLKSHNLHGVQESNLELSAVIGMTNLPSNSEIMEGLIKSIMFNQKNTTKLPSNGSDYHIGK
jgi:hypothetical protein